MGDIIVLPVVRIDRFEEEPADRCDLTNIVAFPRWLVEPFKPLVRRRARRSLLTLEPA